MIIKAVLRVCYADINGRDLKKQWEHCCFTFTSSCGSLFSCNAPTLELRQYKNGLASVKKMFVLKLPLFFPHLHGKGKRAAISKLEEANSFLYCLALGQRLDPI